MELLINCMPCNTKLRMQDDGLQTCKLAHLQYIYALTRDKNDLTTAIHMFLGSNYPTGLVVTISDQI